MEHGLSTQYFNTFTKVHITRPSVPGVGKVKFVYWKNSFMSGSCNLNKNASCELMYFLHMSFQ